MVMTSIISTGLGEEDLSPEGLDENLNRRHDVVREDNQLVFPSWGGSYRGVRLNLSDGILNLGGVQADVMTIGTLRQEVHGVYHSTLFELERVFNEPIRPDFSLVGMERDGHPMEDDDEVLLREQRALEKWVARYRELFERSVLGKPVIEDHYKRERRSGGLSGHFRAVYGQRLHQELRRNVF